MTAPRSAVRPRGQRPAVAGLWLALALATAAGCAAPARTEVPADLPLRTYDQLFTFQWALQQEPTVVRAVGRVQQSLDTVTRLTLALYGIAPDGSIASRGFGYIRFPFSTQSTPFVVELTPTGREVRFELRVLDYSVAVPRMH